MCGELCKDFYVVYQLEMVGEVEKVTPLFSVSARNVAGEVESSCQLVVTFFFFVCFFWSHLTKL